MAFEIACDTCGSRLRIQDEHAGKRVKCPKCSAIVATDTLDEEPVDGNPFSPAGDPSGPIEDINPYASPEAMWEQSAGPGDAAGAQAITPGIRTAMSQTRPWVIFMSILAFIYAGMVSVGSIGIVVFSFVEQEPPMLILAVFYLLFAVCSGAGGYYLFVYGLRIGALRQSDRVADLEAALVAQKSFWKLAGVVAALMLVLMVLFIAGTLVVGLVLGEMG